MGGHHRVDLLLIFDHQTPQHQEVGACSRIHTRSLVLFGGRKRDRGKGEEKAEAHWEQKDPSSI